MMSVVCDRAMSSCTVVELLEYKGYVVVRTEHHGMVVGTLSQLVVGRVLRFTFGLIHVVPLCSLTVDFLTVYFPDKAYATQRRGGTVAWVGKS